MTLQTKSVFYLLMFFIMTSLSACGGSSGKDQVLGPTDDNIPTAALDGVYSGKDGSGNPLEISIDGNVIAFKTTPVVLAGGVAAQGPVGVGIPVVGTFTIDESTNPKKINIKIVENGGNSNIKVGSTYYGIYDLTATSFKIQVNWDAPDQESARPTSFTGSAGTLTEQVPVATELEGSWCRINSDCNKRLFTFSKNTFEYIAYNHDGTIEEHVKGIITINTSTNPHTCYAVITEVPKAAADSDAAPGATMLATFTIVNNTLYLYEDGRNEQIYTKGTSCSDKSFEGHWSATHPRDNNLSVDLRVDYEEMELRFIDKTTNNDVLNLQGTVSVNTKSDPQTIVMTISSISGVDPNYTGNFVLGDKIYAIFDVNGYILRFAAQKGSTPATFDDELNDNGGFSVNLNALCGI